MKKGKLFKFLLIVVSPFILISVILFSVSYNTIRSTPIQKHDSTLRILSMNVTANNILKEDFQTKLLDSKADIIVVIEWTGNNLDLPLFNKHGYHILINHPRKVVHGICVLSKIKGNASIIEAPINTPCTLPIGQIRIRWSEQDISLFAIHAPPPVPSCKGTNSDYIKAISHWIDKGRIKKEIGNSQVNDLVIFAGDFNCFSFEDGISTLRDKKINDTNKECGITSQTWKPFNWSPYIGKIDYILTSQEFESLNSCRFIIPNSDHLAIISDLKLTK